MAQGVETVLEAVSGDDVLVVLGGGVDVVIVGGYPGFLELLGFHFTEFTERSADFHSEFGDRFNDIENLVKTLGAVFDAFPGCPHAETG